MALPDTRTEGFYYVEMYRLASSMRADAPMKDEVGPWYLDDEWPGMWYDLNTELLFWPVWASNRLGLGQQLGRALRANARNGHLNANVRRRGGVYARDRRSMSIGAGSNQMLGDGDDANLLWTASDVWAQCQYEYDAGCFGALLLPLLRGGISTYEPLATWLLNGTRTARLHLPPTDLPAYPDNGWDCSYDIGTLTWALGVYLQLCRDYEGREGPFAGVPAAPAAAQGHADCDMVAEAQWLRDNLTPVHADTVTGIYAFAGKPFSKPNRHFDHLLAFVPLQVL